MHNTYLKLIVLISVITLSFSPLKAKTTIALLDTGVDSEHPWLKANMWSNSKERLNRRDDDRNGYKDDIEGWNFIKMDNSIFLEKERGTFDSRFKKYYEVRAKRTFEQASEEELAWYKEIRKDEEFMDRMRIFRRFIHGTHVAGVAVGASQNVNNRPDRDIKILPLVYLGDAKSGPALEPEFSPLKSGSRQTKLNHIKKFISKYSTWQKSKLKLAIKYAAPHAKVINGSFGTSTKTTFGKVEKWYEEQFPKEKISDELKESLGLHFSDCLVDIVEQLCREFPKQLFVFSAGNKKSDNDKLPHYPSNARCENLISVAAHDFDNNLAYFSNFGKKSVDVLAPGFAVVSSVPDFGKFQINGTSQAAPYVANLAAKIINVLRIKTYSPTLVKKIITSSTSAHEKVLYGTINSKRALYIARSLTTNIIPSKLINKARSLYPSKSDYLDGITAPNMRNLNADGAVEELFSDSL